MTDGSSDCIIARFHQLTKTQQDRIVCLGFKLDEFINKTASQTECEAVAREREASDCRMAASDKAFELALGVAVKEAKESERNACKAHHDAILSRCQATEAQLRETQRQLLELGSASAEKVMQASQSFQKNLMDIQRNHSLIQSRQQNSSLKGKDAELEVATLLSEYFPTAEIEPTGTTPHRGDFILHKDGIAMMIEVKDYDRNVQKAEIEKFKNDIKSPVNNDIKCGLMLSMRSGICKRSDFELEVWAGKPTLYIHNWRSNSESIIVAFSFFKMLLSQTQTDLYLQERLSAYRNAADTLRKIWAKRKKALRSFYQAQLKAYDDEASLLGEFLEATTDC